MSREKYWYPLAEVMELLNIDVHEVEKLMDEIEEDL